MLARRGVAIDHRTRAGWLTPGAARGRALFENSRFVDPERRFKGGSGYSKTSTDRDAGRHRVAAGRESDVKTEVPVRFADFPHK